MLRPLLHHGKTVLLWVPALCRWDERHHGRQRIVGNDTPFGVVGVETHEMNQMSDSSTHEIDRTQKLEAAFWLGLKHMKGIKCLLTSNARN